PLPRGIYLFRLSTVTSEDPTLPLHDALPIFRRPGVVALPQPAADDRQPAHARDRRARRQPAARHSRRGRSAPPADPGFQPDGARSEEHTSELQSRENLVCRLLLETKNDKSRP